MKKEHTVLIFVNALYLVPLFVYFLVNGKWEFLAYIAQVIALLVLLMVTIKKTQFPTWLLSMLSVWAALHMAGGSVPVGDGVLYGWRIFDVITLGPTSDGFILKYDQIVHFFGFFTTTFVAYWLLLPQVKPHFRLGAVVFVAILASMGFGAVNEIIEFGTVLAVPENGVGGYYNTAIDLVANGLGALTAGLLIIKYKIGVGVFGE